MGKFSDQVLQQELCADDRWQAYSAPVAGTTCTCASPTLAEAKTATHVDSIVASIINDTAAKTNHTITVKNTTGGTVIGQIKVAAKVAESITIFPSVNWTSKRGQGVTGEISGAAASVTQTITIAGWRERFA